MKKENKNNQIHICHICGKDINPDDEQKYIKTRRGTELWMHKKCVKEMQDGRDKVV